MSVFFYWLIDVHDQVVMIRENRVGTDVDGEDFGQQRESVLDVLLPGRIILASPGIDPTQEMAPNTAADEVIEGRYIS